MNTVANTTAFTAQAAIVEAMKCAYQGDQRLSQAPRSDLERKVQKLVDKLGGKSSDSMSVDELLQEIES